MRALTEDQIKILDATLTRIHSYIRDFNPCIPEPVDSAEEEHNQWFKHLNEQYKQRYNRAELVVNPNQRWRAARGSITRHNEIKNPNCILTDSGILDCSKCPWGKTRILREAISNHNMYTDSSRGTYVLIDCDIVINANMNETSILTFLELAALLEMKK